MPDLLGRGREGVRGRGRGAAGTAPRRQARRDNAARRESAAARRDRSGSATPAAASAPAGPKSNNNTRRQKKTNRAEQSPEQLPVVTRDELLAEAKRDIMRKRLAPSKLKRKLNEAGIKHSVYKDCVKEKLIDLLAATKVDGAEAVNREHGPEDPYKDMPALIPAVNPPDNGFWLLKPTPGGGPRSQQSGLHYAYYDGAKILLQQYGAFDRDADIIPSFDGNVWVSSASNSSSVRSIAFITQSFYSINPMYSKVDGTVFVSTSDRWGDCRNGVWALCPARDRRGEQNLVCVNFRYPRGQLIARHIPLENSRLVASGEGGVWLFIPTNLEAVPGAKSPGLWFITTAKSSHVLANVHERAIMSHDKKARGVWIVEPSVDEAAETKLTHVAEDGKSSSQMLKLKFDDIQCLCHAGDTDGVYLCYKLRNHWNIGYASHGVPFVKQICACQPNSDLMSCGSGGAWVWSRRSATAEATLSYLGADEKFHVSSEKFPANSRIGVV